jgi:hypothetical protein
MGGHQLSESSVFQEVFVKAGALARRHEELVEGMPGANAFASAEIEERLAQLDLILEMVRSRQERLREVAVRMAVRPLSDDDAQAVLRVNRESLLLTEAFYLFANRIATLIEDERLPHLTLDPGHVGIVRNQMFEHYRPDPDGPFARVFTSGGAGGPTVAKQARPKEGIGSVRSSGGLFDNAQKFATLLERQFEEAIAAAAPRT